MLIKHRGAALGFDIDSAILEGVSYVEQRPILNGIDIKIAQWLLFTKYKDWNYEQEARIFTTLTERDSSGLYFGEFNEKLVLREVIVGPLSTTTKHELRDALGKNKDVALTKGRLAFNSFEVVKDKRVF